MDVDAGKSEAAGPQQKSPETHLAIKAICPKCDRRYRLDERYAGRTLKCRGCGEPFETPRNIQVYKKPVEAPPGAIIVFLRRMRGWLTGNIGRRRIGRRKWLSDAQARWARLSAIGAAVMLVLAGVYVYSQSDSAAITFGTQAGKEIAYRQIVELEEELASTLAQTRKKKDIRRAARTAGSILSDQTDLWQALAGWRQSGFLTDGEFNILKTRYQQRLNVAEQKSTREQLRIAKLDANESKVLVEAVRRVSADLHLARRMASGAASATTAKAPARSREN